MNKKITYALIIFQFIAIIILYHRNIYIPNKISRLIETLSVETRIEIDSIQYEVLHQLNSSRIERIENNLKKIDKLEGMNTYTKEVPLNPSEKELIDYLLDNLKTSNKQEKRLILSFIEYLSLKSIENCSFNSYFHFEQIYLFPNAFKSTINLGETYEVFLPICGINEMQASILVLDGDTVETKGYENYYSEQPTTTGKIKHSGYLIVKFMNKDEMKLPVDFEYTVVDKE